MDFGWIVSLADPAWPGVRSSPLSHDEPAPVLPAVSIEVDDVDARVRRFIACNPDGKVVNVLSHR